MRRRLAAAGLAAAACCVASLAAQVPQGLETFDAAWRIVRDTHFDKTFNGVDWEAARTEFRPQAEAAKSVGEIRRVITSMLSRLGQSHFAILPASAEAAVAAASANPGDAGFDIRLLGTDIVVTGVDAGRGAAVAGVRPGWRLTSIGGKPVADLVKTLPESADRRIRGLQAWRMVQAQLRGAAGSSVDLIFDDNVRVSVERSAETGQSVVVGSLPKFHVRVTEQQKATPRGLAAGVIGFNVWMIPVMDPFNRAVDKHRAAAGIVIDLRGNPGGLAAMMMGLSGNFVSENKILGVMKTRDNTLEFRANPRLVDSTGKRVTTYAGPVAILVDPMSGSASECFAGGMQSLKRVRVFGETTMGQALPALFDKLPNGDVMIHAFGDFVTSDGTRLEGRGVIPDEVVPLRREDLLAGRDRALEAALAWIDQAQGPEGRSKDK